MSDIYRQGEYALEKKTGELVKIIGSTSKKNIIGLEKIFLKIVTLNDIDAYTKEYKTVKTRAFSDLIKINQEEVQFLMKMVFEAKKFELIRQF